MKRTRTLQPRMMLLAAMLACPAFVPFSILWM